jgi:hypothetical protein
MGDWSDKLDYEYREYYGQLYDPDREEDTEEETEEMTTVEILKEMAFTATETQRRALEDAISALSENKGEWIYQQGVVPYKWRCNKCEKMFKTDFNYCPNCGADMRGEE